MAPLLLLFMALASVGCAHRSVSPGLNYLIPVSATHSIELVNCKPVVRVDLNGKPLPPDCKHIKVDYAAGTEMLEPPKK